MPGDRITIVRVWSGEDARAWHRALSESPALSPQPPPESARTLKREGQSWVRSARLNPGRPGQDPTRDVIIKCRTLTRITDRLKSALRAGRADRHWRGAAWLIHHGFRTARPLVLARVRGDEGVREVLVLECLPGRTVLDHLAARSLGPRSEHEIAREAGRLIARLSSLDRFNRDCKPSNLMVTRLDETGVEIAMIDTVAIRPSVRRRRNFARMLASLIIESVGTGNEPRNALKARAVREAITALTPGASPRATHTASMNVWSRIATIVRDHGDPTPLHQPTPRPFSPSRTAS